MNNNTLLLEFAIANHTHRLVRLRNGHLVLERKYADLLGDARWDGVKLEPDALPILAQDRQWAQPWKDLACPVPGDTSVIFDTRGEDGLHPSCHGVIHLYASKNCSGHAPDSWFQEIYVQRERRALDFATRTPVLIKAVGTEAVQVYLGAMYMMVRHSHR